MSDIEYSANEGVAIIRFNRPASKNALTEEMQEHWKDYFQTAQKDPLVRAIVVTGTGDSFCAGGDLKRRADRESTNPSPLQRKERVSYGSRLASALEDVDKPIIAAVNGVAAGAGMDAALICDIRFAARSARFSEAYMRSGLLPGEGGCFFLPKLIGTSRALHLLWTGDFIESEEALRIGLVDRVFDDDQLMGASLDYAKRLAGLPPIATRFIKRAVYQSFEMNFRTHIDMLSSHSAVLAFTDDAREAITAFREKRQGNFQGK